MTEISSSHYINGRFYPPAVHVATIGHEPLTHTWIWAVVLGLATAASGLVIAGTSALKVQNNVAPAATSTQVSADSQTPAPEDAAVAAAPESQKPSSDDLQALLNIWQADYKGATFGVVVKELGGTSRSASLKSDTAFDAASLYKLYLAYYLYNKIDKGVYSLSSTVGSSQSLGTCLKLMITVSDNNCGESIGYAIGWRTLQNFAHAAGFSETTLSGYNTTTASDVAKYLEKLEKGELIRSDFRDRLLGYMRAQIYRAAIPAGVPGVEVADKVGFLTYAWNDAAIVYHPKGTYVLVVLSKNAGTAPIKDLSKRISDFMNQ